MKLLTFLGAFLLVTTGTWASSRNCAKGPEYWCRDASTAKACGAVRHCEQTVWRENRNDKPSMAISETAEMLCNVLVQASTALLTDKSVERNAITEHLRQDCIKLPNENNLVQHCQLAVDVYLSDILRQIESGTESTKICPLIQRHDGSSAFVPKPKIPDLKSNATCVLCEFILHIVEAVATVNASEQELILIFEQVCTKMPEVLRSECKDFVDSDGADLIALLVREVDPAKACELIKICPKPYNVAFLTKSNLPNCGLCDYVSTSITAGYRIENVCAHFPTDNGMKQRCEILVHLYKPEICEQLPLCFDDVPSEKPIEKTVNSVECSICQFVVTYVDKVIQSNKSEAAIEAALDKVCTILPKAVNATCVGFVTTYGPFLVQLIEKYGTPDLVCQAIRLCPNGTQEITLTQRSQTTEPKTLSPNSIECTLCEFVLNYIDKSIGDNRSIAAIEAAMEKVCNVLPTPVRANCTSFVNKYGPIIALLLAKNSTPEQVCDFLKLCNNGTQQAIAQESRAMYKTKQLTANPVECSICKYVVSFIDTVIENNKTEAAIEAALEKVCSILPKALNDSCVGFVVSYGPLIVQLLEKYGTPELVCDALSLCKNGTQKVQAAASQVLKVKVSNVKSVECSLCKFIVGYVEKSIENNKSEAAIIAALDKVCSILPHKVKHECDKFVKEYGPRLVQLIEKYSTPDEVCEALTVCKKNVKQDSAQESRDMYKTKELSANPVECSICKYVVSYVDAVIQTNKSEAAVEKALEKVCTILPHALNNSCYEFVETNGPKLAEYLANYGTPSRVCDALKLCKNDTREVKPVIVEVSKPEPSSISSVQCSICQFVVSYVDKVIQSNKSEAAIEAALDKVCTILPKALNDSCVGFVVSYGPVLVQLLEKYDSPDVVCQALGLCKNGTEEAASVKTASVPKSERRSVGSPQCSLCKLVINYLDLIIKNNKSEAAIESALEKVCTIMPHDKKAECIQFVDNYGLKAIELLEKLSSPNLVCLALGLCLKGTEELTALQSVGSVECSLCKYVVSYVDAVIQTNKSETAIDTALEKVCTILPHALAASCVKFIDAYGPEFIEHLANSTTSDKACAALKVCTDESEIIQSVSQTNVKSVNSDIECTLCKYVISFVNTLLENNATEQEIAKGLEVVCSIWPSGSREKCDTFVKTYGPILPQLIAELDDPNVVCGWLAVCPKSDDKFIEIPSVKSKKLNSLPCNLCQYLVHYLDAVIQSNSTETQFEKELEKACQILPSTKVQSECRTVVDLFGTDLIKFLVEFGTPEKVCETVGICRK